MYNHRLKRGFSECRYVREAPTLTGLRLRMAFLPYSNTNTNKLKKHSRKMCSLSSMLYAIETLLPPPVLFINANFVLIHPKRNVGKSSVNGRVKLAISFWQKEKLHISSCSTISSGWTYSDLQKFYVGRTNDRRDFQLSHGKLPLGLIWFGQVNLRRWLWVGHGPNAEP